jgi:hypothetical protein
MTMIETGLWVTTKTQKDFETMKNVISKSDFYAEINDTEKFLFFAETPDCYDHLEKELTKIFDKAQIYYTNFEAV